MEWRAPHNPARKSLAPDKWKETAIDVAPPGLFSSVGRSQGLAPLAKICRRSAATRFDSETTPHNESCTPSGLVFSRELVVLLARQAKPTPRACSRPRGRTSLRLRQCAIP